MHKKILRANGECAKGIYEHNCNDSCKQNFSITGEYAKGIYTYIENAIKNLSVQEECAKRIYEHIEYVRKESMSKWRKHKTQRFIRKITSKIPISKSIKVI
jgi:hypothetical protein